MSFAQQFCRKMHVALDILHVIGPGQDPPTVNDTRPDQDASGGENDPAGRGSAHLLKSENPPKAIANYIDAHRNIVLAIYDGRAEGRNLSSEIQAGDWSLGLGKSLGVPLVVMRA